MQKKKPNPNRFRITFILNFLQHFFGVSFFMTCFVGLFLSHCKYFFSPHAPPLSFPCPPQPTPPSTCTLTHTSRSRSARHSHTLPPKMPLLFGSSSRWVPGGSTSVTSVTLPHFWIAKNITEQKKSVFECDAQKPPPRLCVMEAVHVYFSDFTNCNWWHS